MKTLEVSSHIGCRHNCHFCPQAKLVKAYKPSKGDTYFGIENYVNCIDKVPEDVRIDFSGYAEPFFHPQCGPMIAYASQKHEVHVYTTLMGADEKNMEAIRLATFVKIHVPDTEGLIVPDDEFIRQHEMFLRLGIKASYMAMGSLTPKIRAYFDDKGIEVEMPTMLSRGGNNWQPKRIEGKLHCSMDRWHQNVLLPNGDVYLCCMDYSLTTRIGNLLNEDYATIWSVAENYRNNQEPPEICRKCEWAVAV